VKLGTQFTRSSAETAWKEFVEWIGFSALLEALERKHKSLADWTVLEAVTPQLFSIEYGLASTLRKWRSTRKLWYPKDKSVYDAYSFVGACVELKHQLTSDQARIFRRRVISEILPSGRLCHLDHEFRSAQGLLNFGWDILHFGFCGDPGPDFIARRNGVEIELESKCLSPEIGLGISYEYAVRLLAGLSHALPSQYPNCFTTVRINIMSVDDLPGGADSLRKLIVASYLRFKPFTSDAVTIQLEKQSLDHFLARFPHWNSKDCLTSTFAEIRTREGDYGYFIRRDNELIFCNLVPMRPNQQAKKIMKLISSTCERQFSKQRPALLWLHLQGLEHGRMEGDPDDSQGFFRRFARHAFMNERRNHVSSIMFSGESAIEHQRIFVEGKTPRHVEAAGRIQGFDNVRCRFGKVHVFAPLFSTSNESDLVQNLRRPQP
jgi:hypothetical protein